MRRLGLLVLAMACGVALLAGQAPASASTAVRAVATWSMVPQARDVNKDGVIDGDGGVPARGALSTAPSTRTVGAGNHVAQPNERLIGGALSWYLDDAGYPVRLDACRSGGQRARWLIDAGTATARTLPWRPLRPGTCATTVVLPEGPHTAALEVRGSSGSARASLSLDVSNLLVVALGDSYASGEGNPRNVQAWLRRGAPFTPYWDDDACDRSARGAPARAALTLEESSPTTSVTVVDVACAGATIDRGLLGPQSDAGQAASQVEQVRTIVGDRPIDAVLLTIGGNDVGFGTILQTCALNADCATTLNPGVQARTRALADQFARVSACFGGSGCALTDGRNLAALPMSPGARILPMLYPDITRSAAGQPCTYLSIPAKDFAWARSTILDPNPSPTFAYAASSGAVSLPVSGSLNQQIAATSRLTGWRPVGGAWAASGESPAGHGVCAGDQAWVFGFTGFAGFANASFHPNPTGTDVMAQAFTDALGPSGRVAVAQSVVVRHTRTVTVSPVNAAAGEQASGSAAVRQIEHWYKKYVDDFVQEGRRQGDAGRRGSPGPITGPVLAYAHEQAWRHGIVRAQRAANPHDWGALTVAHEAAAYEHLLGWTAHTYRVPEGDIRASQTNRGYRHHER